MSTLGHFQVSLRMKVTMILYYAYNIVNVVLFKTQEGLQSMLNGVVVVGVKYGMEINISKSHAMKKSKRDQPLKISMIGDSIITTVVLEENASRSDAWTKRKTSKFYKK